MESNEIIVDSVLDEILDTLKCSCCFNIYINPVRIKGCLHTFCKECIERNMRVLMPAKCILC